MRTRTPFLSTRSAGFSLVEFTLATSLMLLMLGGVVYSHIMGQNLQQWSMAKVGANDQSREALARLQEEIRSAKRIEIGDFSDATFSVPALGRPQVGQTIRILPTTNTALYVQYRMGQIANVFQLRRMDVTVNGVASARAVAKHLTNNPAIFGLEDFRGNTLTEPSATTVVRVTLDFKQFQYPITQVGTNYYYDHYRLQTRIAKRAVE